jgi:hypothetical protein
MLAGFRNDHIAIPDLLLTDGVATPHEGLIDLQRLAQDGMKVRASTGTSSFRCAPLVQNEIVPTRR